jgi:hypothetical protein
MGAVKSHHYLSPFPSQRQYTHRSQPGVIGYNPMTSEGTLVRKQLLPWGPYVPKRLGTKEPTAREGQTSGSARLAAVPAAALLASPRARLPLTPPGHSNETWVRIVRSAPDRTGKGGEARLRVLRSGFHYSGTRPEIDGPLLLLGRHTDYGIWAS